MRLRIEINMSWSIDDREYSPLTWPRKTEGERRGVRRGVETDGMEVQMDSPAPSESKRRGGESVAPLWRTLMSRLFMHPILGVFYIFWIYIQVSILIKLSASCMISSFHVFMQGRGGKTWLYTYLEFFSFCLNFKRSNKRQIAGKLKVI